MRIQLSQLSNPALGRRNLPRFLGWQSDAFTLIEVMVACFVFFTVSFSILTLTMQGTVAAKALQKNTLDHGMFPSRVSTNRFLKEGVFEMDVDEFYPDTSCTYTVQRVNETNDLFQVDFVISSRASGAEDVVKLSTLLYRPGSPKGPGLGGAIP